MRSMARDRPLILLAAMGVAFSTGCDPSVPNDRATLGSAPAVVAARPASHPLPARFGVGRAATEGDISALDIDIMPDGTDFRRGGEPPRTAPRSTPPLASRVTAWICKGRPSETGWYRRRMPWGSQTGTCLARRGRSATTGHTLPPFSTMCAGPCRPIGPDRCPTMMSTPSLPTSSGRTGSSTRPQ